MQSQRPFGDEDVEELWHSLRADVRRTVRCSSHADDVVQEAWLRTLETPPTKDDRLASWLRVVARHFLVDDLRASQRREKRESEVARREHVVDAHESLLDVDVSRLVGELDEPHRTVVRLRFVDECSVSEIAARLGLTEGVVRRQLKAGLDRLRVRLVAKHDENGAWRWFGVLAWPATLERGFERARAWGRGSTPATRAAVLALVLLVASLPWVMSRGRALEQSPAQNAAVTVVDAAVFAQPAQLAVFDAPEIALRRVAGTSELAEVATTQHEPPRVLGIFGKFLDRRRAKPIAGARILGAVLEDDGVGEFLTVTDVEGRFELPPDRMPLWVWAEHQDYAPTWRKRVPLGFERTSGLVVIDAASRFDTVEGEGTRVVAPGDADPAAQRARERRDAFLLVERPPAGSVERLIEVRSLENGQTGARQARSSRRHDATARLSGRLAGAQLASGDPLQVRVRSTQSDDDRRIDVLADGRFEIDALAHAPHELWIEGGGLHGAWKAATIHVDTDAGIDVGEIVLPPAAALRVQVHVPGAIEVPGPAGFVLSCDGVELRAQHRTLGAGIAIDRTQRTLAIERLWPGAYRLDLFGTRLADRASVVNALPGELCALDVAMDPGIQTFVVARSPRDLEPTESVDVLFHTHDGSYRYDFATALLVGPAQRLVRFNAGLPDDVVRIELVSSGGLHGEADLAYSAREQNRRVEFELRQR